MIRASGLDRLGEEVQYGAPHRESEFEAMLRTEDIEGLDHPTAQARGLPGHAYTSEEFARQEQARLFARTWTFAGYAHEVPDAGSVMPRTLAGVPLLFTRTRAGEVRCFHNICTHRGSLLVDEAANGLATLRCRYHGWTYDLDGALRLTPHWGGHNQAQAEGFEKSCHGLKPVRMARWYDWIFVNVDGLAEPFADYAAPFMTHVAEYDFDDATWALTLHYDIAGNWKLVAENYLETLHLDFVHTLLAEAAPFQQHEVIADGACLGTIINVGLPATWTKAESLPRWPGIDDANRTAKNLALFPNFKFVIGPDHACSMVEFPDGAGQSHQRWDFYFHGDGATAPHYADARKAIIEFFDTTNVEDFNAVEAVHKGHMSPAMQGARFNGIWEGGVHHFQKLVAHYMSEP